MKTINLKKYLHFLFITIMLLLIIVGSMIIYNNQKSYASETWVYDCLKAYSSESLSELDIQVLSKNLSNQIDEKLSGVKPASDLTDQQLRELMAMVNSELQYADFSISQDELSRMSSAIVNKIISNYTHLTDEKYNEYENKINIMETQLTELRQSLENMNNNDTKHQNSIITSGQDQINNIMNETGLSEEVVRGWLNELSDIIYENKKYSDDAFTEVAKALEIDEATLKELIEKASETDNRIEYLLKKLGITEEKLNEKLSQTNINDGSGLFDLAAQLKSAQDDLQKQIDNNHSLVNSNISSVQSQVTENKRTAESSIAANKSELEDKITSNQEETDKKISENKEYTDIAIEELQTNVLFYQYDPDSNTLRLFEKPKGDGKSAE